MTNLRAALERIAKLKPGVWMSAGISGDECHAAPRIAREALAAAPPAADSRATFERILASLHYDGDDINSLTVGEIRRALPVPATVSDSNKSVTEDELRTWLYQQFSKPTPLCDALLATYTITKKEAGL